MLSIEGGNRMLRMEIALFLILAFVAYIYFSAEKKHTQLHKTFSVLLVVMLFHLVLDGITVYTVNHLETVPVLLNDIFHRFFIGTMIVVFFLFPVTNSEDKYAKMSETVKNRGKIWERTLYSFIRS